MQSDLLSDHLRYLIFLRNHMHGLVILLLISLRYQEWFLLKSIPRFIRFRLIAKSMLVDDSIHLHWLLACIDSWLDGHGLLHVFGMLNPYHVMIRNQKSTVDLWYRLTLLINKRLRGDQLFLIDAARLAKHTVFFQICFFFFILERVTILLMAVTH